MVVALAKEGSRGKSVDCLSICLSAAGVTKFALGPDLAGISVCFPSACGFSPFWLPSDLIPEQDHAPTGPGGSFQLFSLA